MKSDCMVCRGACCETIVIPAQMAIFFDAEWRRIRGRDVALGACDPRVPDSWEIPCACPKLTADGLCGIYDTRPLICRHFEPGSFACLSAIERRRTPEQAKRILWEA